MDDEYFNIDVEFTAHETERNMEKGTIYMSAKFASYKQQSNPINFYRMGHMQYKASFLITLKEALRYIPFISYFRNCEPTQIIRIPVAENFNNKDFQTNSIELTLSNTHLQFSNAEIKVRTSLFGIRYLMRQWFYTTAFVIIASLTTMIFISMVAFYFAVQGTIKKFLYWVYPEATQLMHKQHKPFRKAFGKDLSTSQTSDPFSMDTSSSDDTDTDSKGASYQ